MGDYIFYDHNHIMNQVFVDSQNVLRVSNVGAENETNTIISALTAQGEAIVNAIQTIIPIQNNTYTYNYPNCIIQSPSYDSGETFYNAVNVIIVEANGCINDLYFEASEPLMYSTGSDFMPLQQLNATQQYIPYVLRNDARRTFVISGNMESITAIKTKENWYNGFDYYRSWGNWFNYDCGHLKQSGIFQIFLPSSANILVFDVQNQHLSLDSSTNILLNLDLGGKENGTVNINGAPTSSNGKIAIEKLKKKNWIVKI